MTAAVATPPAGLGRWARAMGIYAVLSLVIILVGAWLFGLVFTSPADAAA